MHSTSFIKKINKKWILIDAKDIVLGRLSAFVAKRLQGKHLPDYTPHMDCGDYIVIINADKISFKGNNKGDTKFHWHTGYPGGLKSITFDEMLENKPEKLIFNAVKRMLPKTKLGKKMLTHLRLFKDEEHTHEAQSPTVLDFKAQNIKNNMIRGEK